MSSTPGSNAVRKGSNPANTFEAIIAGVSQKVAYSTSTQSAALSAAHADGGGISVVRLVATTNCHVAFGANPTAAADGTSMYLPLGVPILVGVVPGSKIAAIQDSAPGNLFITEGFAG